MTKMYGQMGCSLFLSVVWIGLLASGAGAEVTVDPGSRGDTDVNPNPAMWYSGTDATIGNTGHGELLVNGESMLSVNSISMGVDSSASGVIRIDGLGSEMEVDAGVVGDYGDGQIVLTNGGVFNAWTGNPISSPYQPWDYFRLGKEQGSSGSVHLSGEGTSFTALSLMIGDAGYGEVILADNATLGYYSNFVLGGQATGEGLLTANGHTAPNPLFSQGRYSKVTIGLGGVGRVDLDGTSSISTTQFLLGIEAGSQGTLNLRGDSFIGDFYNTGIGTQKSILIGDQGQATVHVSERGLLYINDYGSKTIALGYRAGGSGTVVIDGPEARFMTESGVHIGKGGTGNLALRNGGSLSFGGINVRGSLYLGTDAGSVGVLTVDGPESVINDSGYITVGHSGRGEFHLLNGASHTMSYALSLGYGQGGRGDLYMENATITTSCLIAGESGLHGTGTINTRGLVSDVDLVFDADHPVGSARTFVFDQEEGTRVVVNLAGGSYADLGVGYEGSHSMTIRDGQSVSVGSDDVYLGYKAGSHGTLTMESGSLYTDNLIVGNEGQGTVSLDGGTIDCDDWLIVGKYAGSQGTMDVFGSDSKLDVARSLTRAAVIGDAGQGEVTVRDGALYLADTILGREATGVGTLTLSGAITPSTGTLSSIIVGDAGTGTLNLLGGMEMNLVDLEVGVQQGSFGLVNMGNASLTVDRLMAGASQLQGTATIAVATDLLTDGHLVYDTAQPVGSERTLTFDEDPGQLVTVTWTDSADAELGIGYSRVGSMSVLEGQGLTTGKTTVGYKAGSDGSVVVSGAGSKWEPDSLTIGKYGLGEVTVQDGGSLLPGGSVHIGSGTGSHGILNLVGVESTYWPNGGWTYIGGAGDGELNLSEGAVLNGGRLILATSDGSSATVRVEGQGTRLYASSIVFGASSQDSPYYHVGDTTIEVSDGASLAVDRFEKPTSQRGHLFTGTTLRVDNASFELAEELVYCGDMTLSNGGTFQVLESLDFRVDEYGQSNLEMNNGILEATSVILGANQLTGSGRIVTEGIIGDMNMEWTGSTGSDLVVQMIAGQGTGVDIHLALTDASVLGFGNQVGGELSLINSANKTIGQLHLGRHAGVHGTLSIESGSRLALAQSGFVVGREGQGTVNINGVLDTRDLIIGEEAGSQGVVTLDGSSARINFVGGSETAYVGHEGTGELYIRNGAQVHGRYLTPWAVGGSDAEDPQSGYLLVDGPGSLLDTKTARLSIVQGSMDVLNGAVVKSNSAGITGSVLVSGASSQWILSTSTSPCVDSDLTIGYSRNTAERQALVEISDGAYVIARSINIGEAGHGKMIIRGAGTEVDVPLWMNVGRNGDVGFLQVDQGAELRVSADMRIGRYKGNGTAVVTGPDSTLSVRGYLAVGDQGTGSLFLADGATVLVKEDLIIGRELYYAGEGHLALSGGSTMTVEGDMVVGNEWLRSGGAMSITNQSLLTVDGYSTMYRSTDVDSELHLENSTFVTSGLNMSLDDVTGTGQITTTTLLSSQRDGTDVVYDNANPFAYDSGPLQFQHVTEEGVVNITATTGADPLFVVGYSGEQRITIAEDQHLSPTVAQQGVLGYTMGGNGILTIDGPNAQLTAAESTTENPFLLGEGGKGVLNVQGGKVSAQAIELGRQITGEGSVLMDGATARMDVGSLRITYGQVEVTDQATLDASSISIGCGDLKVSNGATVQAETIGLWDGEISVTGGATVQMTGQENYTWTDEDRLGLNTLLRLSVRDEGSQLLMPGFTPSSRKHQDGYPKPSFCIHVSNGGRADTGSSWFKGERASLVVTGAGSTWNAESISLTDLGGMVGSKDTGLSDCEAVFADGATVNSGRARISMYSYDDPRTPRLRVQDPGTTWNLDGKLDLDTGGEMTVANGAEVTISGKDNPGDLKTASHVGTLASLTLTDPGTVVICEDGLGISDRGRVNIADGARMLVTGGTFVASSGGILNIEVSNHSMLHCVAATGTGIGYQGDLHLSAQKGLAAGVYQPITVGYNGEFSGQNGLGENIIMGGAWDPVALTYTVTAPVVTVRGQATPMDLASQQRLTIGSDLRMQFGSSSVVVDVTATETAGQWLASLRDSLYPGEQYLTSYDFDVINLPTGDSVQVSMQIAPHFISEELTFWHGDDESGWESFTPDSLTIKDGWATFLVDSFSSYALSTDALNPGDANKDGVINVGDLGILSTYYGMESGATWELGDFNGDGQVNVGDLGLLSTYYDVGDVQELSMMFTASSSYAPANVPEPTTLILLAMGMVGVTRRRNRRRRA
jgi:fibronectin-binding autotransporter adhesin